MFRTRKTTNVPPTTTANKEDDISSGNKREIKMKKGLKKRIEVLLSKILHENPRTKRKKIMHIFFAVFIVTLVLLVGFSVMDKQHYYHDVKVQHNMVQLVEKEDYSRIRALPDLIIDWRKLKKYRTIRHKYKRGHEIFEEGNCRAMHSWQMNAYPTCNTLHETEMSNLKHAGRGGFRDVWELRDWDGTKIAVKTLSKRKDFTWREYDRHRRDAVAMSLLTSSKHIPNIYGFCTNSGLFTYSPNGSMEDHIFKSKQRWNGKQKLQFSWQAAAALASVHNIGMKKDSASISHTDVSVDQFLWLDGMYKLNDFNRARFIRWDNVKDKPCPFYIPKNPGRNRSPEEYNYENLTEKIDVYSLGNIFYIILTQEKVFPRKDAKDVMNLVKEGKRSELKKYALPEELALVEAIDMCWVQDPADRSSARDVELFLRNKLLEYNITMY